MHMPQSRYLVNPSEKNMLKIIRSMAEADIAQLLNVYKNSLAERKNLYRQLSDFEQTQAVENDFYLNTMHFLEQHEGVYAVWVIEGAYVCAVRLVQFGEDILFAGLETEPNERRRGYASRLICAILKTFLNDDVCVYVHVRKDNTASVRLHKACGFVIEKESAVLLDGTVSNYFYTMRFQN